MAVYREYKVQGTGHGMGYASYKAEATFTILVDSNSSDDEISEALSNKAINALKRKTCCDCVTVSSVNLIEERED